MLNRWFYEPKDLRTKCIHITILNDLYFEIYKHTSVAIERFAKKIGADINIITKSKFIGFPDDYERMQIWEDGKDYQWNIYIGADAIIHPDTEDPTLHLNPLDSIGTLFVNDFNSLFYPTAYFFRHQIPQTVPLGAMLVSSWYTHDVWEPLQMPFNEMSKFCKIDSRQVSEFNLTVNICKYSYKLDQALIDPSKCYATGLGDIAIQKIKDKLQEWGI